MRILIADDEATSRHLIQATLGGWGFEVLVAVDGCEALRVLQESRGPEIAMLDWMMPGSTAWTSAVGCAPRCRMRRPISSLLRSEERRVGKEC